MAQLIIVFFIEIVFCCIGYIISNGVFVNPSFMSFIMITISTMLAIIGNSAWNVKIDDSLILVVLFGLTAMLLGQIFAKKIARKNRYQDKRKISKIIINKRRYSIVIIVVVLLTILYCIDIIRAGMSLGSIGLSAIYAVKGDNSGTNVIIRQGVKIVMAFAYIHMFFFVNNFVIKKDHSFSEFIHIVPALCGVICSIFTSVRTDILRLITAFIVDYCVLYFQSREWKRRGFKQVIRKVTPVVAIGAVFMTGLKSIVKGTDNATSLSYGLIEYICYYVGSPIIVLGSKLNIGLSIFSGNIWGENTFNQAWIFLQRIGLLQNLYLREGSANVWIEESKRITANVDTIFGSPMIDFGIIGMIFYILILYFFINLFFYKKIYRTETGNKRDCNLVVFSYIATLSSMAYYTNYFNRFLTVYFILTLILIRLFWKIYRIKYLE